MLKRIIILLIPAIFAVCGATAQVNIEISQEKVLENGQKFYLHTVQQGQTLYSICKAYSVKEKRIKSSSSFMVAVLALAKKRHGINLIASIHRI